MAVKLSKSKKWFHRAVAFALLLAAMSSCSKGTGNNQPFGFTRTGNHSDSLLQDANEALYSFAPVEKFDSIVTEYIVASEREDSDDKLLHRRLYWRGTALFMHGYFEEGDSLRSLAFSLCDSASFPHDWRLYRMTIEQPSDFTDNIERYSRFKSDYEAFAKQGDLVGSATRAVQLSQLFADAGMSKSALKYAFIADSLFAHAGLHQMRLNNSINVATVVFAGGDTLRAVSILESMRGSLPESDPTVAAILDYNLYGMTGDTASLLRGWNNVKDLPHVARLRSLMAASMIGKKLFKGSADEELEFIRQSDSYDYLPEEELEIKGAYLKSVTRSAGDGEMEQAANIYISAVEHYLSGKRQSELISAEFAAQIHEAELNMQSRHDRKIMAIVLGIVILIALVALFGVRYRNIQRRRQIILQLEIEEQKRRQLDLRDRLDQATLTDEMFLQLMTTEYPKVGRTGRLLALYIRKGMNTAEIAQSMGIRKESVIQGRWRLRTQMGLCAEHDLESVLANMR